MPQILIVDDCPDSIIFLKEFIVTNGYACRFASSGQMAMELISLETFELVISDYQMENGDGIWFLNELKKINNPPKVIMTTADLKFSKEHFLDLGAAAFCPKPINWPELISAIETLLG